MFRSISKVTPAPLSETSAEEYVKTRHKQEHEFWRLAMEKQKVKSTAENKTASKLNWIDIYKMLLAEEDAEFTLFNWEDENPETQKKLNKLNRLSRDGNLAEIKDAKNEFTLEEFAQIIRFEKYYSQEVLDYFYSLLEKFYSAPDALTSDEQLYTPLARAIEYRQDPNAIIKIMEKNKCSREDKRLLEEKLVEWDDVNRLEPFLAKKLIDLDTIIKRARAKGSSAIFIHYFNEKMNKSWEPRDLESPLNSGILILKHILNFQFNPQALLIRALIESNCPMIWFLWENYQVDLPNAIQQAGQSPLHAAIKQDHLIIGDGMTFLIPPNKNRKLFYLQLFLSWGLDIDQKNRKGETPLQSAAMIKSGPLFIKLLDHGASAYPVLMQAIESKNWVRVKNLVQNGYVKYDASLIDDLYTEWELSATKDKKTAAIIDFLANHLSGRLTEKKSKTIPDATASPSSSAALRKAGSFANPTHPTPVSSSENKATSLRKSGKSES